MTSPIDISQFSEVFFDESQELLDEMENLLLTVNVSAPGKEECNAIFRTAHSIKGGAATFGMADMVEVTHIMESLLDKIRKGETTLTEAHVNVFLQAKDLLRRQLGAHRQKQPLPPGSSAEVMKGLRALACGGAGAAGPAPPSNQPEVRETPPSNGTHYFRIELPEIAQEDSDALLSELGLKGDAACEKLAGGGTVLTLATLANGEEVASVCAFIVNPEDIHISETAPPAAVPGLDGPASSAATAGNGGNTQDPGYGFFEPYPPAEPGSGASSQEKAATPAPPPTATANDAKPDRPGHGPVGSHDSTSIRVNLEKVDQLINLVGELVITQAMIDQHAGGLDPAVHESLINSFASLARNTRDLQEAVMSIRMMPMDFVFSRFPRMARELAAKLGKKVKLATQGGATELDKGLIERISDPLTHLLRNAIDHGLETPAVRLAAGKSETGTIQLSAAHEGGNIIVEVSDDGAGLDRGRILAKAREQGLAIADETPDEEVWPLVFAAGFSTSAVVTDVSGRGVGMDVVRRAISAMGGSVDIHSSRGQGTTVKISLPLTLAILEGMSIKAGDEIYILPLAAVVESLKPSAEDTRDIAGRGHVIRVRDEYLPLIPLHALFGIQAHATKPADGIVVVLEAAGKKAALLVDGLVAQQQVVVKNIESNYRRIPGISGATILGDGNVSLILDVPSLLGIGGQFDRPPASPT